MEKLAFSVKCTREEYMNFCVKNRKSMRLPAIVGAVLVIGAVGAYFLQNSTTQIGWLLMLVGLIGLTAESLWLPMVERGAAGRRYDASDSLQQAVTVTIEGDTLTVRTACQEGQLPLSLMTQVCRTPEMTSLVFGRELTVYIPSRVLNDDERAVLERILTANLPR